MDQLQVQPIEEVQPFSHFMVISEKNLFAEDRQPEAVETASEDAKVVQETPPKWRTRPQLHGVTEVNGEREAMMTTFETEGRNSKGQLRTVKLGDRVQSYTVTDIVDTVVKLGWKDQEEIIKMADATQQPAAAGGGAPRPAIRVLTVGTVTKAVEVTSSSAQQPQGQGRGTQGRAASQGRGNLGGQGGGLAGANQLGGARGNQGLASGDRGQVGGMQGMGRGAQRQRRR